MKYYIIFYFSLLVLTILSILSKKKDVDLILCFLLSVLSIIFIGGRYNVGADFPEYQNIFYYVNDLRFEWGFSFLFSIFRDVGLSYSEASLGFYFFTLSIYLIAIRNMDNKTLLVSYFILFCFIPLTATIRQGMSLPFIVLAVINIENRNRYFLYTSIGVLFHASCGIMFILYFLKNINISRTKAVIIIIIAFAIGYLSLINYIITLINLLPFSNSTLTKILTYSTRYNDPMSISSQAYRVGALLLLFAVWNDTRNYKDINFCKNIYLFVFLLSLIFKDNGVLINRISFSTNVVLIYLVVKIYSINELKVNKLAFILLCSIYFSINYFKFTYLDLRYGYEKAYLPYQNFILNDAYEYR
ncbi:TPA: EpsG family protein [Photobacterium damselae]